MTKRKIKHHIPENVPWAKITQIQGDRITIMCPYCKEEHTHAGYGNGRIEHRVAGCRLHAPVDFTQRATGYKYTTSKRTKS